MLLPCVGSVALGALTAVAEPGDRTGADAPHQERNLAKNEKKSALPLSEVAVPEFSDSQKPVRKATAVKTDSTSRKAKDKKKAERQAKAKPKTEAVTTEVVEERPRNDYPQVEDRVGSDAPHQERSSDPGRRSGHLIILER